MRHPGRSYPTQRASRSSRAHSKRPVRGQTERLFDTTAGTNRAQRSFWGRSTGGACRAKLWARQADEHDRLFALSELSFAYAEDLGKRSYYLASAVYAYAFLFPQNPVEAPGEYDPRVRLAVDLYNRGVALGLGNEDGKQVDLSERQLSLPFGSLSLRANSKEFAYGGDHLSTFVSIADLKVRGFRNTYRRAGIGAAVLRKNNLLWLETRIVLRDFTEISVDARGPVAWWAQG
jgi:hypothetical protein